jgi:hypothetical protein
MGGGSLVGAHEALALAGGSSASKAWIAQRERAGSSLAAVVELR